MVKKVKNKSNQNDTKKKIKLNKKAKIMLTVAIILIVICCIFTVIFINLKSSYYSKKIKELGFDEIYNKDNEVSKVEAVRMTLASIFGRTDPSITFYGLKENTDEQLINFLNERMNEFKEVVTVENMNENLTIVDELIILYELTFKYTDYNLEYKQIYTNDELNNKQSFVINIMLNNQIIDKQDFTQKLTKDKLNEIVVRFIDRFNSISNNE